VGCEGGAEIMTNGILGKKLGMTQVFTEQGSLIPVTVIEAGPCKVSQVKTIKRDGYESVQLAFQDVQDRKLTKAQIGHLRKANLSGYRILREFKLLSETQLGELIGAGIFTKGEWVDVEGISKGKGFQGVMKRHHYKGGPETHGSMFHRAPGSIGSSSSPSRVWKNKKLPGHMGSERVTVQRLKVIDVRPDENLILIEGAVPGPTGGTVAIKKSKKA
jgi:large subunit ribosomal protein L3